MKKDKCVNFSAASYPVLPRDSAPLTNFQVAWCFLSGNVNHTKQFFRSQIMPLNISGNARVHPEIGLEFPFLSSIWFVEGSLTPMPF